MNGFEQNGFIDPFRVFSRRECRKLMRSLPKAPAPADWHKGYAVTSQLFLDIARREDLSDRLESVLGAHVMLWGASIVRSDAGQVHCWHTDVETAGYVGRAASVWIGLENTNRNSSLQFIVGSHKLGSCLQKVAYDHGKAREQVSTSDVNGWAEALDSSCHHEQLEVTDGQAFLFDGRLWHCSDNTNEQGARTAMLLQYATPDMPIRIWLPDGLNWPLRFRAAPRPPCIMIRGEERDLQNRIVKMPLTKDASDTDGVPTGNVPALSSTIQELGLPRPENAEAGWAPYPLFAGATPNLAKLNCHFSVLSPDVMPHEPHVHEREEILVMIEGEADLVTIDEAAGTPEKRTRVKRGSLAYYPAYFRHTICNVGAAPAVYLMLTWTGMDYSGMCPLEASIVDYLEICQKTEPDSGMAFQKIFDGPTLYLQRLHCHLTTILPGAGYAEHVDSHDDAIISLEGSLDTLGSRVTAPASIFYPAGESHGMANETNQKATYLVFEFHRAEAETECFEKNMPVWKTFLRWK